jgi:GntR family transcriptional regulator
MWIRTMIIELNFKSGKPAYLQIVEQVKYSAAMGELKSGDALPSIRSLAEKLRINRNTAAKAYSHLEHEGVVQTIRGKGVFLTDKASPFGENTRTEILKQAMDSVIVQAHHFKVKKKALLDLLEKRFDEFEKRRSEK